MLVTLEYKKNYKSPKNMLKTFNFIYFLDGEALIYILALVKNL